MIRKVLFCLVGTLNLKSNVEFHLESGAVLKAAYYTNALKAVKVNNLKMNNMTAFPSPSNPKLKAVSLRSCTKVTNNCNTD